MSEAGFVDWLIKRADVAHTNDNKRIFCTIAGFLGNTALVAMFFIMWLIRKEPSSIVASDWEWIGQMMLFRCEDWVQYTTVGLAYGAGLLFVLGLIVFIVSMAKISGYNPKSMHPLLAILIAATLGCFLLFQCIKFPEVYPLWVPITLISAIGVVYLAGIVEISISTFGYE